MELCKNIENIADLIEDKVRQCEEIEAEILKYDGQKMVDIEVLIDLRNEIETVKEVKGKEIDVLENSIKSLKNDISSIEDWLGKRPV